MNPAVAEAVREGWQASLALGFEPRAGRTALVHRRQRGPLAVQRPFYPEGETCHLYLLHPPGGVVGGDRLDIAAETAAGAHALVTTPGATKFYLSAGSTAYQTQSLRVLAGAKLEWLPQENIYFPGALAELETKVSLDAGASFVGWEIQCLGRPVIQEAFTDGRAAFRLSVMRDGKPLLLERLQVFPGNLNGAAGLRGQPVSGTFLATPASRAELERVRALLTQTTVAAATLLEDLLVVRYLGDSTERCRKLFSSIWAAIRPSVIGREPCLPRIWST